MATTQPRSPPRFFTFLKEGLLLPKRNLSVFTPVFTVTAALAAVLVLANYLVIQPLSADIVRGVEAIQNTNPASPEYGKLIKEIQTDVRELLLAMVGYLVAAVIVGSIIKIITISAAVVTYSGERHTISSLLCKVKANLKCPVITMAFAYVLEIACAGLIVALALLVVVLMEYSLLLLFLDALLVLLASLFLIYLAVVCTVAIVVSVAEPGSHGAGAVGRAWRLMTGKNAQAVLYIVVMCALGAVSPLYTLATRYAPQSVACGALLGFVYVLLLAALELFSMGAITAYYYECRQSKEEAAVHGYEKLASDEANI